MSLENPESSSSSNGIHPPSPEQDVDYPDNNEPWSPEEIRALIQEIYNFNPTMDQAATALAELGYAWSEVVRTKLTHPPIPPHIRPEIQQVIWLSDAIGPLENEFVKTLLRINSIGVKRIAGLRPGKANSVPSILGRIQTQKQEARKLFDQKVRRASRSRISNPNVTARRDTNYSN
ncbi:hypothetical protein KGQ71_01255 [Patescibacteria group bacterium]|nr:hypothetical protein [Patescibacteria group bacterium]